MNEESNTEKQLATNYHKSVNTLLFLLGICFVLVLVIWKKSYDLQKVERNYNVKKELLEFVKKDNLSQQEEIKKYKVLLEQSKNYMFYTSDDTMYFDTLIVYYKNEPTDVVYTVSANSCLDSLSFYYLIKNFKKQHK